MQDWKLMENANYAQFPVCILVACLAAGKWSSGWKRRINYFDSDTAISFNFSLSTFSPSRIGISWGFV